MKRNRIQGNDNPSRSEEKGFTLVEVLIVICILTFGLLAVASMQTSSIIGNSLASDMTEATAYASERLEILNRLAFIDYNDSLLNDDDGDEAAGLNHTGGGADHVDTQGYYKIYWNISVNVLPSNTKTVNVIVHWESRGVTKSVSIRNIIAQI
jgi:type IV pilus assembly protein PilV